MDVRPDKGTFQQADLATYDAELNQGISLSGEDKDFFAMGRLEILAKCLQSRGSPAPSAILDYGCGAGDTTVRLAHLWTQSRVVGVDTSESLLSVARTRTNGQSRCEFYAPVSVPKGLRFDLVYCNGVFHHIPPAERDAALNWIQTRMAPAAWFALWENNSWNPGTRWVMRRIPFDRGAIPLSPLQAIRMLKRNGFAVQSCDFAFVFPKCLKGLRPLEPWLRKWPIGAQYQILSRQEPPPCG